MGKMGEDVNSKRRSDDVKDWDMRPVRRMGRMTRMGRMRKIRKIRRMVMMKMILTKTIQGCRNFDVMLVLVAMTIVAPVGVKKKNNDETRKKEEHKIDLDDAYVIMRMTKTNQGMTFSTTVPRLCIWIPITQDYLQWESRHQHEGLLEAS